MLFVSHVSVMNAMSVFSAIKKFCVQFMFEKTLSFALCVLVRLLALITAQLTVERESLSVDCRFIVEFSGFRIAVSKGPGLFSTSPDKEISKAAVGVFRKSFIPCSIRNDEVN